MELIKFEYPSEMTDERDRLNTQMNFLVNRASAFNKENFCGLFILEADEESPFDFILYQVARIVSMIKGLPLYISRRHRKIEWIDEKNDNSVFISRFATWRMRKTNKIQYNTSCEDSILVDVNGLPKIFMGFTEQQIIDIAEKLYGFKKEKSYE